MRIFRNKFINNGNHLRLPSSTDLAGGDVARILPTLVEIGLVLGYLALNYDLWFASITVGALAAYVLSLPARKAKGR